LRFKKWNFSVGGIAPNDTTFTLDNPASISTTNLTLGGVAFKSWNTEADGSGTTFTPGTIYSTAADLTLYAIFTSSNGGGGGGGSYVPPTTTPTPAPVQNPTNNSNNPSSTQPNGVKVNITGSIKTHAAPKKAIPNQLVKVVQVITLDTIPEATVTSVLVDGKPVDAKILPDGQIQLTTLVGPKDTVVVAEQVNGNEVDVPVQEANNPISLANVNFDLASDQLTPAAKKILDKVAAVNKSHGFTYVDLTGHTDIQGSGIYDNKKLSHNQAVLVRAYLRKKLQGLSVDIHITAQAEVDPLSKDKSQTAFALNRRVEIIVK
jgi:outer membrane protein OmpA-like peptidoglycan-associated protein